MHQITIGEWSLSFSNGKLPDLYNRYCQNALVVDEVDLTNPNGAFFFLGAKHADSRSDWPELVVCQRYSPHDSGFYPGTLIVPETSTLFLGAGTRLLAYDLIEKNRLWEEETDCGFWGWKKHKGFVLMSAELEVAVWTTAGQRLWSTDVEPPWDFDLSDDQIVLDIMGNKRTLRLMDGSVVL